MNLIKRVDLNGVGLPRSFKIQTLENHCDTRRTKTVVLHRVGLRCPKMQTQFKNSVIYFVFRFEF